FIGAILPAIAGLVHGLINR
uniref:Hylin-b1 n=1 Tax=Boana lundii TaxID=2517092 RepID=HYB1_BOALU|nr:RecName: Full=Hylin-b1; Short=Hy-b1 [Boana lundii]